ncbi:MAG: inositol monophosphatase family protein, partial [Thermodesulfovibrionales bacterium]
MSDIYLKDFLDVARASAHKAGGHILSKFGMLKEHEIDAKSSGDFVTKVDKESETIIIDEIRKRFP